MTAKLRVVCGHVFMQYLFSLISAGGIDLWWYRCHGTIHRGGSGDALPPCTCILFCDAVHHSAPSVTNTASTVH